MTKRKGRNKGVSRISGAGSDYESHEEIDDEVYVPSELPEIGPIERGKMPHQIVLQITRGKFLAICNKCGKSVSSRQMLPAILDDALAHGRIMEVIGAGNREEEIWEMIRLRRHRRRTFRIF